MVLIALDDEGSEFTGSLWPPEPSFESFRAVWTQDHWYLENFWHQFGNSIFLGVATMVLTVVMIGSGWGALDWWHGGMAQGLEVFVR